MELLVESNSGSKAAEKIVVADQVFAKEFKEPLVHQVVTAYLAGGRSGTKAQKTRSQVRGGGKKPWRQKGTGSARAGTIRSPLWRGGGVVFAAKPRDFSQKVNKKMYRGAMQSILSELVRQNRLYVVEDFSVASPKTKELLTKLQKYEIDHKMVGLIITKELDANLCLASRNIPYVAVCEANRIDPVSLVRFEKIIVTKQAINDINEALSS
jgi:large subunit ribosomal protein L4